MNNVKKSNERVKPHLNLYIGWGLGSQRARVKAARRK
jgi:hypothetical protein